MAARRTVLAGVVGVALIVAAGLFVVLRGGTPRDGEPDGGDAIAPTVVPLNPHEATVSIRANPWPFEEFAAEIGAARSPARDAAIAERARLESKHGGVISEHRFSMAVNDQRVQDIIPLLAKEFSATGTEVFTLEPYLPDDVRVTFDIRDETIGEIVNAMIAASQDRIKVNLTPRGLVIGTHNAVMQARLDAAEWEAEFRARKSRPDDPLLLDPYRPDFKAAHVGAVARDIREKTGVETIVGRELWTKPFALDWRADPMPLREALDGLCKRLRANWYLYEGRIFLLAR